MTLEEIYIYPVKALGGVRLKSAMLERRGLQHDRRYLLVDSNNRFITQREFPKLALLKLTPTDGGFLIHPFDKVSPLFLPFQPEPGQPEEVLIWDSMVHAEKVGLEYDAFFSDYLGMPCHLVYMPESSERSVNQHYAAGHITSFTDGYPILIHTTASLELLNSKLENPVGWNRFRPSLVIRCSEPNDEDGWLDFSVGSALLRGVKPCSRCVVTTIDPKNARSGKEPLRTLATYRTFSNHVYYGQNAVVIDGHGKLLQEGDEVVVRTRQEPFAVLSAGS